MLRRQEEQALRLQIVVISLKDSVERRAACMLQLSAAGLSAEFFDACDGRDDSAGWFSGYDEMQYQINTGRKATAGERGCYASHKALWQRCVDSGRPMMVMEDDFSIDPEFPRAVSAAAQLINRLGFVRLQSETRARQIDVGQCDHFRVGLYTKVPHSAMCYAISPAVARALLAKSRVLTAPVDVFLKQFWIHRQAIFGLSPYTVRESVLSSSSQIGSRPKARRSLKLRLMRMISRYAGALHGEILARKMHREFVAEPIAVMSTGLLAGEQLESP